MKPIQAPGAPEGLILFDGACVFCSRWVRWVIQRDGARRYRFAPIQGEAGRALALATGLNPDDPQSNALIRNGWALFKSDAALSVIASLPGWRWVLLAKALPRPLRDAVYDRVAANRYRFLGQTEQCWWPDPKDHERFLD